jgi:hypothetical protein
MSDFFPAYQLRLKRVDTTLRGMAFELKEKGCIVYAPFSSPMISFILAVKEDKHIVLEFGEVPYRWSLYAEHDPSPSKGSSHKIACIYTDDLLFTADQMLELMEQNPKKMMLNHLHKL